MWTKRAIFRNFIFLEEKKETGIFFFEIKIIPGADLRQAVFALFLLFFS